MEENKKEELDFNSSEKPETDEETPVEEIENKIEEEPKVDYKEELEKAKKRISQAEYTIRKLKETPEEKEEEEFPDEEDKPLTKKDLDSILRRHSSSLVKEIKRSDFERLLDSVSDNDDEKTLIRFHYENSINASGDVMEDLENAKLIANKKLLAKQAEEMKFTKLANASKSGGGEAGQKQQDKNLPILTPFEKKLLNLYSSYGLTSEKLIKARQQEE